MTQFKVSGFNAWGLCITSRVVEARSEREAIRRVQRQAQFRLYDRVHWLAEEVDDGAVGWSPDMYVPNA